MDHAVQHRSKNHLRNIIAFVLWAIVVIFVFIRHENWRDEAQAWLMARDLDIPGLIAQMKYEGHPCLWHLILMPFAKLGLPYETMNIVSIVITAIAVALLLWKSTLPYVVKLVMIFGSALLYYMPIVSRSYCLIPLFLFMNACCYPSRRKHPLFYGLTIALLIQTHVYLLGVPAMMSILWLIESFADFKKDRCFKNLMKQAVGLLLPLLSLLFLVYQIMGSTESSAFNGSLFSIYDFFFAYARNFKIENSFMASPGGTKPYFSAFSVVLAAIFAGMLVLTAIYMLRKKNSEGLKILLIFTFGLLVRVLIAAILYPAIGAQKMTIVFFMAVWLLWAIWQHIDARNVKRFMLIALGMVCLVNTVNTIDAFRDISEDFTDAKNCAEYINSSIPEDAVLLQNDNPVSSAILPYLNREGLYSLVTGEYTSYTTWKNIYPTITEYDMLCELAKSINPDAEEAYVVACPRADTFYEHNWFPEYFVEENIVYKSARLPICRNEAYIIYRIPLENAEIA